MRGKLFILALLGLLVAAPFANATPPTVEKGTYGCACTTSASTACLNANPQRTYLFVQNQGSNPAYVAVGSSNAASTTSGNAIELAGGTPGQAIEPEPGGYVPGHGFETVSGDVACKSTGGSTTLSIIAY